MIDVYISKEKVQVFDDSLELEDNIEERSTAGFVVRDLGNQYMFQRGQKVEIYRDDNLIFAGYIEESDKYPLTSTGEYAHRITCSDNTYLADKRRVALSYDDESAGDIVKDIVDRVLSEEGVFYRSNFSYSDDFSEGELNKVEVQE